MKILLNNNDLNMALTSVSNLGFVPTMGALHKGHISLIKNSKKKSNKTLVSIFVNPKQFNNPKDFKSYPKNIKKDLFVLKKLKVDYVFLPSQDDIHKFKKFKKIKLSQKQKIMCAKFRKGHFEGVLDVMNRLTYLILPQKIYMGEKDFQQLHLVKRFIEKKYKSKIVSCKTIRNKNKLALSSRNYLLKKKDINKAQKLSTNLFFYKKKMSKKKITETKLKIYKKKLEQKYKIDIEYLELRRKIDLSKSYSIKNSKLFIAYFINNVRLIDNF
tara:strand:- start:205 stop:1017 length:813 start_codon:yes stop_codon:yes gene_type:complete